MYVQLLWKPGNRSLLTSSAQLSKAVLSRKTLPRLNKFAMITLLNDSLGTQSCISATGTPAEQ